MIATLMFAICGCVQTAEDVPVAEVETVELENTEIEGEEATDAENAEKIVSEQEEQTKAAQRQWQVYIQPDMPEPFIEVLKLYEEFMNSDIPEPNNDDAWNELWDEFQKVDGKWWYLSDELCLRLMSRMKDPVKEGEEEAFRYSLTDLTGDGFPELIMGYYSDLFDEDYLYVVYYYSETEGIKKEWHTSYFSMSLYEGGIIEYISAGAYGTITYLQFQEETESWEQVACIIEYRNAQSDDDKYYRGVNTADFSDPDNEPMSEEEYREIVERYTAEPVELEWIPLFCSETPDEKTYSKNDEPVTVITKKTIYNSDGNVDCWDEYEYDSAGNHTKHILYDNDLIILGDEWEYDSMGNLTKHTYTTTYQGYTALVEYEYITITPQ